MNDSTTVYNDAVATIRRAIVALKEAGQEQDARNLSNDLVRSGTFLPEVLMTRDSAEELLESLAA